MPRFDSCDCEWALTFGAKTARAEDGLWFRSVASASTPPAWNTAAKGAPPPRKLPPSRKPPLRALLRSSALETSHRMTVTQLVLQPPAVRSSTPLLPIPPPCNIPMSPALAPVPPSLTDSPPPPPPAVAALPERPARIILLAPRPDSHEASSNPRAPRPPVIKTAPLAESARKPNVGSEPDKLDPNGDIDPDPDPDTDTIPIYSITGGIIEAGADADTTIFPTCLAWLICLRAEATLWRGWTTDLKCAEGVNGVGQQLWD